MSIEALWATVTIRAHGGNYEGWVLVHWLRGCGCTRTFPGVRCATFGAEGSGSSHDKAQITILYDAFGNDPAMQKDWGYAALVEYRGKRILFDTGNNPKVLEQNAKARRVDLSKLDFVVMSHRHGDH